MLYGIDGFLYLCAVFKNKVSCGFKTALRFIL